MTYPIPPAGTHEYTGSLMGTVTPGTGFYPLGYSRFAAASRQMPALLRMALGWDLRLPFHLVGRKLNSPGLYRAHWVLDAVLSGPGFFPNSAVPSHSGRIDVRMRLYPDTDGMFDQGVEDDAIAGGFPWNGVLTGLIPALLLRRAWGGDNTREFTLEDGKTFTFTPLQIGFTPTNASSVTVWSEINATNLAALPVRESPAAELPGGETPGGTALWLVPSTLDADWKLSYSLSQGAAQNPAERWDDPNEEAPAFVPLPAP
jgi:hypothetical protein